MFRMIGVNLGSPPSLSILPPLPPPPLTIARPTGNQPSVTPLRSFLRLSDKILYLVPYIDLRYFWEKYCSSFYINFWTPKRKSFGRHCKKSVKMLCLRSLSLSKDIKCLQQTFPPKKAFILLKCTEIIFRRKLIFAKSGWQMKLTKGVFITAILQNASTYKWSHDGNLEIQKESGTRGCRQHLSFSHTWRPSHIRYKCESCISLEHNWYSSFACFLAFILSFVSKLQTAICVRKREQPCIPKWFGSPWLGSFSIHAFYRMCVAKFEGEIGEGIEGEGLWG